MFTDVRRFGQAVVLDAGDQLDDFFASRLGVEPLSGELTPERLLELAAGRKAPLKSFLLTQSRVAGIGNIYADEALWRARLHPLSPAGSMKVEHAERLVRGIVGGTGGRTGPRWRQHRRLPRCARRARLDAGGVPGAYARGRALPAAAGGAQAHAAAGDPANRRDRPLDVLLPQLPGAAAATATPQEEGRSGA